MGRIRSALQSLYQPNDAAWEKVAPAVQVIRPESQDENSQSDNEQKPQEHIVDTVGVSADGTANSIFETYGNDSIDRVEGDDAWAAEPVPQQDDTSPIHDSDSDSDSDLGLGLGLGLGLDADADADADLDSAESQVSDVQTDGSDSVHELLVAEDITGELGEEVTSQHTAEEEPVEIAATAEQDSSPFEEVDRSESGPIAEEVSLETGVEEICSEEGEIDVAEIESDETASDETASDETASDETASDETEGEETEGEETEGEETEGAGTASERNGDVSASDAEQRQATDDEVSESFFEFDDLAVDSEPELQFDFDSPEANVEVETPLQADPAAFHLADKESSDSDEAMDESEQVLNLVQQVLGITPGLRFEADDDMSDQLQDHEDDLVSNASSVFLEDEEASMPKEDIPEAALVSDESSQEVASPQGNDDAAPHGVPVDDASSLIQHDAEEKFAAVSEFQPVMQTWASVPSEATSHSDSEIRAEATPPLSNTPIVEESSARSSDKLVDSALASELSETTESSVFFESVNTGSTDIDSSTEKESPPEPENEFYLPPVEESPEVGAYATQAWSPALGALGHLPDRISATDFERTMAERVLDSDFGTHVQELSHRLSSEIPSSPTTILFLSLEQDDQRAEIVAGLAMHICAQRSSPTLLVDADIQQRWISDQLDQSGVGLGETFDDEKPWYDAVVPTSCENLRFLRSGSFESSKMDDNQNMRETVKSLVKDWKATFGMILIDGGKVDGDLVPLLAEMADATYLTVQLGSDERDQLSVATERLSQFGARLKGCITTAPSAE